MPFAPRAAHLGRRLWTSPWGVAGLALAALLPLLILLALPLRPAPDMALERARLDTARAAIGWVAVLAASQATEVEAGRLPLDQAQAATLRAARGLRHSGVESVFILDAAGDVLLFPAQPELEGQPASAVRDVDGQPWLAAMAATAAAADWTLVPFRQASPQTGHRQEKLGTSRRSVAWNWTIGSAVAVDDLRTASRGVASRHGLVLALLGVGSAALLLLLGWRGFRPGPAARPAAAPAGGAGPGPGLEPSPLQQASTVTRDAATALEQADPNWDQALGRAEALVATLLAAAPAPRDAERLVVAVDHVASLAAALGARLREAATAAGDAAQLARAGARSAGSLTEQTLGLGETARRMTGGAGSVARLLPAVQRADRPRRPGMERVHRLADDAGHAGGQASAQLRMLQEATMRIVAGLRAVEAALLEPDQAASPEPRGAAPHRAEPAAAPARETHPAQIKEALQQVALQGEALHAALHGLQQRMDREAATD
ncbi:cache domain-containing protein [Teichococcus vastitatis]|uniref:Cache domain-containing protein n=1 Tax=Teichococcus vastitatis TaxID=2307076 RepID=A0ABS9W4Y1_9PROT|nr:cache domain-containing protein [Pseudoroseomonas vastitatis]MCI0754273.1 cache domain-containing protein [Pseudoroseomonas vastitatis]